MKPLITRWKTLPPKQAWLAADPRGSARHGSQRWGPRGSRGSFGRAASAPHGMAQHRIGEWGPRGSRGSLARMVRGLLRLRLAWKLSRGTEGVLRGKEWVLRGT
jgi:hypothetical protein